MFVDLSTCRLRIERCGKLLFAAAGGLALALVHGAIPAFAQSDDAARNVVIPSVLLQYKYAPTDFSDQYMLEQTRRQIGADAAVYSVGKQRRPNHVFMFSADQVAGREPTFAAEELLPIYKQRWAALANSIPDRLQFSTSDIILDYMTYANGALRSKHQPDALHEISGISEQTKLRLPPLGRKEVLDWLPPMSASLPVPRFPSSVAQAPPVSGFRLAVDRVLRVPPLTMERAAAERLWRRPECSPFADPGLRDARARRAAQEAAARCSREIAAFKPRITIVFDVQTEGMTAEGANRIVKAKLIGARVLGSRMELLKNLSPSDFPEAVDSWKIQADRKAAEARRTAALQSAKEASRLSVEKEKDAARTAARAELLKADIVGIRLGMTLTEAEQLIRGRMKLGGVASSKPPSNSVVGGALWIKNPRFPYSEFRTFVGADGEDEIVLFSHVKVSDRVLAVARGVQLQPGVTSEMVVEQLLNKYGKAPIFIYKPKDVNDAALLAWAVDFGQVNPRSCQPQDFSCALHFGTCHTQFGSVMKYHYLSVVEPAANAGAKMENFKDPQIYTPTLHVHGAGSPDTYGDERTWDVEKWRGCGPTVLAWVTPSTKPPALNVAIFDLASYADIYLKATPDPKASAGKPPDL